MASRSKGMTGGSPRAVMASPSVMTKIQKFMAPNLAPFQKPQMDIDRSIGAKIGWSKPRFAKNPLSTTKPRRTAPLARRTFGR